ncbi:MAG: oxygenase MpaB family protein [Candidatus Promineifilaceae bacterium]
MRKSEWSDTVLDPLREVGDPLVDDVLSAEMRKGSMRQVSQLLKTIVRNDDPISAELPPAIQAYFNDTAQLPPFADPQKLATAQQIYQLYNIEIGLMLMYAALPATYAAKKGVQVLMLTERMAKPKHVHQRLSETGRFVFDVMGPNGFEPQGRAIRSAQKVRLVHGMVRHHIVHADNHADIWDNEWGTPINQEDMAGTMLAFSVHVLDGLACIGIMLTPDEKEAFIHLWSVVGHFLGIGSALIPNDRADAEALAKVITERHFAPSPEGQHLTLTILDMLESSMPRPLKNHPHAMMRYCLGNSVADMIGVNPADWTSELIWLRFGVVGYFEQMRYANHWSKRMAASHSRRAVGLAGYSFLTGLNHLQQVQLNPFSLPFRLGYSA